METQGIGSFVPRGCTLRRPRARRRLSRVQSGVLASERMTRRASAWATEQSDDVLVLLCCHGRVPLSGVLNGRAFGILGQGSQTRLADNRLGLEHQGVESERTTEKSNDDEGKRSQKSKDGTSGLQRGAGCAPMSSRAMSSGAPHLLRAGWVSVLLLESLRNAAEPPGSRTHSMVCVPAPCFVRSSRSASGWPDGASTCVADRVDQRGGMENGHSARIQGRGWEPLRKKYSMRGQSSPLEPGEAVRCY